MDDTFEASKAHMLNASERCVRALLLEGEMRWTDDGELEVISGGDDGIVVRLVTDGVEVRLPTVVWQGVHTPLPATRPWRSVSWSDATDDRLRALFAKGKEARRAEFRPCRFCRERVPPEHRHGDICHSCAEQHLGVVH
ncbi:MAG: hypothetical protein M3Q71_01030 [Chloroflexota bacterium]|nr:hypothetical protein [Chloroflexota bacterium]